MNLGKLEIITILPSSLGGIMVRIKVTKVHLVTQLIDPNQIPYSPLTPKTLRLTSICLELNRIIL